MRFSCLCPKRPNSPQAWGEAVQALSQASALDAKRRGLAYLAVPGAMNRVSGIPYQVTSLKENGATREETISAILVGLPAAGHLVTQALPAALEASDAA